MKINTQIFEKDKPVKFDATVRNYSERAKDNLVVSLFINGERLAQQSLNLNPGESKTANIEASVKNFGYSEALVEIEDDDLLEDNKRYTSFFIPEKIPVLILADNLIDTKLIEAALKSVSEQGYFDLTIKRTDQISGVQSNSFQVIILVSDNFGNAQVKLNQFLSSGKGIIIFPSSDPDQTEFNSSISAIGIPSSGGLVKIEKGQSIRFSETDFNIARTQWTKFHLQVEREATGDERAVEGRLVPDAPKPAARLCYPASGTTKAGIASGSSLATSHGNTGRTGVSFETPPLERDTEVTGPIVLNLCVESTSEDLDIFATLRNIGPDGKDVCEVGQHGQPVPCVTKGWLRASHRKLDAEKSRPYRPYHAHDERWWLKPGEVVECQVEIWSTSMVFAKGQLTRGNEFRATMRSLALYGTR